MYLADGYEKTWQLVKAEKHFIKAIFLDPDLLFSRYRLALLYYKNGEMVKFDSLKRNIMEKNIKIESSYTIEMKEQIHALDTLN